MRLEAGSTVDVEANHALEIESFIYNSTSVHTFPHISLSGRQAIYYETWGVP